MPRLYKNQHQGAAQPPKLVVTIQLNQYKRQAIQCLFQPEMEPEVELGVVAETEVEI